MPYSKPTPEALRDAAGRTVPDVIAPNLCVLFCGINPGLYSGAVGYHFAHPGNRFWKTLHAAGFTDRLLESDEGQLLIEHGYGITNLVERATTRASELSAEELQCGARVLAAKVERYAPAWVAFVGIGAYRTAFGRPRASVGPQEHRIHDARVWVLPNPSGLNAHYTPADLADVFRTFRMTVEEETR